MARVHATLRKALADAERDDVVSVNVAVKVSAPSGTKPEPHPLPIDKVHAIFEHKTDDPWHIAFVLMLGCGLRVGETLALRWSDVDLDSAALSVRRQVRRQKGRLVLRNPNLPGRVGRSSSLPS